VQAGIAACHARALRAEDTDWDRIADLYAILAAVWPSPVVEVNRAVAVGFSRGPEAGLEVVDRVAASGRLAGYPHLHGVRADLLERAGRHTDAVEAFERAAALTRSEAERAIFTSRAAAARDRM
jgi:predicted RNA polymerase sigma factor